MLNIIFFAVYLLIVLVLFSIIILMFVRIREVHIIKTEALTNITRIFVGALCLIALFGGYKILTGKIFPTHMESLDITVHL